MTHQLWSEVRKGYTSQLRAGLLLVQSAEIKIQQAKTFRYSQTFLQHLGFRLELEQESLLALCTIISMYYPEIKKLSEFANLPIWNEVETNDLPAFPPEEGEEEL